MATLKQKYAMSDEDLAPQPVLPVTSRAVRLTGVTLRPLAVLEDAAPTGLARIYAPWYSLPLGNTSNRQ